MRLRAPCLTCGEPTKATRCEECEKQSENMRIRKHSAKKQTTAGRGYGGAWQRLSKRARELQNFCSDCGATTDLQGDHSPQAWKRYEKGLPLRLSDIDVVCGHCNRKRGAVKRVVHRSGSWLCALLDVSAAGGGGQLFFDPGKYGRGPCKGG